MKFVLISVFVELLVVAWIDFKEKKISNFWILLNIGMSIGFHLFLKTDFPLSGEILLFPLGWLVIGFFLFRLKIMGAGDSKFLASLFLLVPYQYHVPFFGKLVFATILVGSFLLLMNVAKNLSKISVYAKTGYWAGIKEMIKSRFSYAPVILLAWIYLGSSIWK